MALGAQRKAVLELVLKQGAVLVAIGIAAGIAGAAALTRYLEGMLFGLGTLDVTTFALVAIAFAAVAMAAAYLPARRATTIDPARGVAATSSAHAPRPTPRVPSA